jgi:hypothetical protein
VLADKQQLWPAERTGKHVVPGAQVLERAASHGALVMLMAVMFPGWRPLSITLWTLLEKLAGY